MSTAPTAKFVVKRDVFMKRRKLLKTLGILFVVALCLITVALAYTVPSDTIVYITPTGSKYHREDCSYTTTVRGMTIEQAERKGYGACSRCEPDEKTGVYTSSSSKSSSSSSKSYAAPAPTPTPEPEPEKPVSIGVVIGRIIAGIFVALTSLPIVAPPLCFIYEFIRDLVKNIVSKTRK